MSCTNWEEGTLVLSVKEFAAYRKRFLASFAAQLERDGPHLRALHQAVSDAPKKDSGSSLPQLLFSFCDERRPASNYGRESYRFPIEAVERQQLYSAWVEGDAKTGYKLRRFSAAAFKLSASRLVFSLEDSGSVSFEPEKRALRYAVPENNRAVERARDTFVGRLFFEQLRQVKWTRQTGGCLLGNDEYNEDRARDYPGSGGSYVTARFGPLGEEAGRLPTSFSRKSRR